MNLPDSPYEMMFELERQERAHNPIYDEGPFYCLCNERTFCWCRKECEKNGVTE